MAPGTPDGRLAEELARVELVAVGDILMHQDVKTSAVQAGSLTELWKEVTPLFKQADIAFANLETPIAPRTGRPGRPFQFNAPEDLPAALKASGLTIVSTANNHAFDQGPKGLAETLERLEAAGLPAVGSGPTRALAEAPRILEVKGLRIAFLAFTDIFNVNLNQKAASPWVRSLDPAEAERAVAAARAQSDAVVVSIHWGAEYLHAPLPRQKDVARRLARAGADLILGHHPHVLQAVEVLETGPRRTVVAYSLGNFISNQDRMYRADLFPVAGGDSRDGVLFRCRFVKLKLADGSEPVRVEDARCEPLWTRNNWQERNAGKTKVRSIEVIPLSTTLAQAEGELDRLRAAEPMDKAKVVEQQEYLRTLYLRRARAAEILGAAVVVGGRP
ncbi:CapA family protein [Geothrix sp. 21YS21S-2]|uniref:CapA family protein n=1 Tax=Geothrix sp. 21YS21S-2 TaxID=3068893 RepID=UPI0027B8A76E|nr:CapA family protein [Geothrix sp. 21YS21S-2]